MVTLGGGQFCKSFEDTELESCSLAQYVRWHNNSKMNNFYEYLTRAQISYWLMTHAWLVHSTVTLIRWITNSDYVIAEERELHENPIYGETALQSIAENQETLTAVSLFSKNKAKD
ncbi:uncharacterized protein LOC129959194 [Argiope bruennichi]|nr:uncharacterized protein LOC129959194 [Argiope bruennichi]